jgi:1,4-dihydroxy-2-naphthoate octaprenyltransferase
MLADVRDLVLLAVYRFFLIYAICILFDYRDREEDRQQGIRSLITFLPEHQLDRLYYISLLIAAGTAVALAPAVPLYVLFSLLAPVAVTALVKGYAQKHTSDYVYYFFLDGLMMLSALLHFAWMALGGI